MSQTTLWIIILLIGLFTFGLRFSFILLYGKWQLPPIFERGLRFVPPAVLTGLVLPALIFQAGSLNLTFSNPRFIAGLVAFAVAWGSKSVLATIGVGMITLWILQAIL